MNIQEYIASGKLESYLLGLLTAEEAREVERMAADHQAVRAELNAMEEALSEYARAKGIPMPEGLPERILRRIDALGRSPEPINTSRTTQMRGDRRLAFVGVFLAMALIGVTYLWIQNNSLQDSLQQTREELETLQQDCNELRNEIQSMEAQLAILRSGNTQIFIMRGTDKAPDAIANVYYNPTAEEAYLDVRSLPPPPPGQQYQLWGLVNGTDPVSMDVFDIPADESFISVPYVPGAQVFAVTLEPAGGRPSPTLEQMYLIS